MCPGQIGSSRHKIILVSLLLGVVSDRAMPLSKSLKKFRLIFEQFNPCEVSVGWVGRWLEMMKCMLTQDLFSMLDTPIRPVSL